MCSHTPAFALVPWPRSAGLTVSSLLTTQEIHPYICYVEDFPCNLLERFSSVFFFLKTVLLRNSFAHLLLSTVIQAKGLLWKWESFLPVNGSNTMTRSMQPSSLYKLLLLNYLSCYLSFLPHCKGWWHKTSSDTSLEINQKLQSTKTNTEDKDRIISRICKLRFNSKPLCCSTFLLSIRGVICTDLSGKGHPVWSLGGQLLWDRIEDWKLNDEGACSCWDLF